MSNALHIFIEIGMNEPLYHDTTNKISLTLPPPPPLPLERCPWNVDFPKEMTHPWTPRAAAEVYVGRPSPR